MKPRIFIGSSTEALPIAYEIQEELTYDMLPIVWTQDIFNLSSNVLDDILDALGSFDYGIFVFKPDDITKIRNNKHRTVRDNVVFEFGIFIGKLGKNKVFYLIPQNDVLHIPSDLIGTTPGTYDPDRMDNNLRASLGPFCNQIRKAIKKNRQSHTNLDIKEIGYFQDFSETFKKLFAESNEISVFFIHSRTWRENHHDLINKFLDNKKKTLQVFLPNILNKDLIKSLEENFDDGKYILTYIEEAYNFFLLIKSNFPSRVQIKTYDFFPTYSFYKFDHKAIVAMYATTPKRKNVPSFLIQEDTGFWEFFKDDYNTLSTQTKEISDKHINKIKKLKI